MTASPLRRGLALTVSLLTPTVAGSDDWPQWGGPGRDFTGDGSGIVERFPDGGPPVLWRRPLGDGYSGISVVGDRAFTMVRDGRRDAVVALEVATGRTIWQRGFDAPPLDFMDLEFGPGPHSTPLVARGSVFAVGTTGRLVALDAASGRELWSRDLWQELGGTPLERGYAASPVAFGDLVIVPVGGERRALVAFHQDDGATVWRALDDDAAYASPILIEVAGEPQLVALLDTSVVAVDPSTGAHRWSFPVSDYRYVNVASPLASEDGLLFLVSSEGGRVLRLTEVDGRVVPEELWVGKSIGSQVGNVVRVGDHLYGTRGAAASKVLSAVGILGGEVAWRDRSVGDATILEIGARALLLESDGTLHLARLSPSGLDIISSAQLLDGRSWTAPALAGTRLLARNRKEIVCVELGDTVDSGEEKTR